MTVVEQHSSLPFEIATVDGLFTEAELDALADRVYSAEGAGPFTRASFKNGKVVDRKTSALLFSRLQPLLPSHYTDAQGQSWQFVGGSRCIMFAELLQGQEFDLHTDTGCDYDPDKHEHSKFTVLICLTDAFQGGATQFFTRDFKTIGAVQNCRGRTLIFDIDLPHRGCKVTSGRKVWLGNEIVCRRV